MLWSAIHAFLSKKQLRTTDDECDFSDAVGLLARWNGFKVINPAHLVPDNLIPNGRLQLGQGLVAEKSVSASENYIVLKRLSSKKETQNIPLSWKKIHLGTKHWRIGLTTTLIDGRKMQVSDGNSA